DQSRAGRRAWHRKHRLGRDLDAAQPDRVQGAGDPEDAPLPSQREDHSRGRAALSLGVQGAGYGCDGERPDRAVRRTERLHPGRQGPHLQPSKGSLAMIDGYKRLMNLEQPPAKKNAKGFFTDTSLCIGCKACEVACKQWNQLPADGFAITGNSYDNTG